MSSSVNGYSDGGEADVQQNNCETLRCTSMMETPEAVNITPTIPYVVPPPVGAMAQAAFPYPDPYYRSIFVPYDSQPYPTQPYPAQSMVHLQHMGIQQPGVPLPLDTVEEPIFVNAKQYHGILRRRQSRSKAESENRAIKVRKPYLHESRHLHAVRRSRGCGGRFVNSKKEIQDEVAASNQKLENEKASSDDSQPVCIHDENKTRTGSAKNFS